MQSCKTKQGGNSKLIDCNAIVQNKKGQRSGPPDTILEEDHPMAILSKFGSN